MCTDLAATSGPTLRAALTASADAQINDLTYDRHEEEVAVNAFARSIRAAAKAFLDDPLGAPLIPNWNRVESALPDFFQSLNDAVRKDNAL